MSAVDQQLALEWFEKAEHDLFSVSALRAIALAPTDVMCFHCHQVAEKYLKGFLTWHAIPVLRTHDLEALLGHCMTIDASLATIRVSAALLTDYAIDVRYPGLPHSDPTLQETAAALDAARDVRASIRRSLGLPV